MSFLKVIINNVLTLEDYDTNNLTWYINVVLALCADMKSHIESLFTMVKVAIINSPTKQRVNPQRTTESELIGADNKISKVLWMKRFLECQGFLLKLNITYQDNPIIKNLEENGKYISEELTRNFDMKYCYVTDLVGRNEVKIEYCPIDEMIADYMKKLSVCRKFKFFCNLITNLRGRDHRIGQQECHE